MAEIIVTIAAGGCVLFGIGWGVLTFMAAAMAQATNPGAFGWRDLLGPLAIICLGIILFVLAGV